MRRSIHIGLLSTSLLAIGCGEPETAPTTDLESGRRFVEDRAFRRAALEASVVNPDNMYSAVRLEQYGLKRGGWDTLDVYDPAVVPVRTTDFGSFDSEGRRSGAGDAVESSGVEWTHESLMAAGQWAFQNYPMVIDARLAPAMASRENADEIGLWVDTADRVGGLVATADRDGRQALAWTCATCHAATDDTGALVLGRTNVAFDSGRLYRLGEVGSERIDAWGAGRVDTSRDNADNPVLISDIRSIRHQSHLHHTATLRNSLTALAIRVETLLIVSQHQERRPPRELAFALAYYMWNLSPPAPSPGSEGRDVFEANCARCHHADGSVAAPVEPETVGTDASLGDAPGRGTGRYRIPSLVGVSDRALLLHDGSVNGVEQLLNPQRPAQIEGHEFGHDLSAVERERLLAFVRSL